MFAVIQTIAPTGKMYTFIVPYEYTVAQVDALLSRALPTYYTGHFSMIADVQMLQEASV